MKRVLLTFFLLLSVAATGRAGGVSSSENNEDNRFRQLDSLIGVYCESMLTVDFDEKAQECDFMISSCTDSVVRSHVALKLFDYYQESPLMGDESVAVHIYDQWFATHICGAGEMTLMTLEMYSTFNRSTLIGEQAPQIQLLDPQGQMVGIPSQGQTNILFFFDVSCSKCRVDINLLPAVLEKLDFDVTFTAVYCGAQRDSWDIFRRDFTIDNPKVHLQHLWDPEDESEYQMLYGVLSTPRLYVTDPSGMVIGRRLEPDSMIQVLSYAAVIQDYYSNNDN